MQANARLGPVWQGKKKSGGTNSNQGEALKGSSRQFPEHARNILCCPRCEGDILIDHNIITCAACGQHYSVENGVPLMFWPNEWECEKKDVTQIVKSFYEKNPFPNYDEHDSAGSLIDKAKRSVFIDHLDQQIPFGTLILEVGCGTGQLTNLLGISNRTVVGTDICVNSLRLGQEFKEKNRIAGSHFLQMNLFRPVFKPESFHLVYCTGVLHHTSDPFGGFRSISRLVRPNGYIIIGLYHRFGRMMHNVRRTVINMVLGERAWFLDPRLRRSRIIGEAQCDAWFADQYEHPHESRHTITEVLHWFKETGFRLVKSIPKTRLFEGFRRDEGIFNPEPAGDWFERRLVEYGMVFTGRKEGGYFVAIGQRNAR